MLKVKIPYTPRPPQPEIHKQLLSHRFSVLVAHRRLGKTVVAVNHLIRKAISTRREDSRYAYVAPFRNQAKEIAWGYLKRYTAPVPGVKVNESDLFVALPNGAQIRIFGADNPDALRGLYFDGVVLDEVAQMKTELWGQIVRPALSDRKGWAVFIGTPKGINLFSETYEKALAQIAQGRKEWSAMSYAVTQTNVIDPEELESLRQDMSVNDYRQEFLCDFNASADDNLIPIDLIKAAAGKHVPESDYSRSPRILGVDVARFGGDSSVIFPRQGLVAFQPEVFVGLDNMEFADRVALKITEWKPDAVNIDIGNGSGVIDRLRQLGFQVNEIAFGGGANRPDVYANRRAEMWFECRDWLKLGGAIPPDTLLQADLAAPTYGYNPKGLKILERKEKVKERIGRSPDRADGLVLTFAVPVRPRLDPNLERQLYRQDVYDPDAVWNS